MCLVQKSVKPVTVMFLLSEIGVTFCRLVSTKGRASTLYFHHFYDRQTKTLYYEVNVAMQKELETLNYYSY